MTFAILFLTTNCDIWGRSLSSSSIIYLRKLYFFGFYLIGRTGTANFSGIKKIILCPSPGSKLPPTNFQPNRLSRSWVIVQLPRLPYPKCHLCRSNIPKTICVCLYLARVRENVNQRGIWGVDNWLLLKRITRYPITIVGARWKK